MPEAPAQWERFYRLTLEAMHEAVFLTDDGGRFRYVCPNVERTVGRTQAEIEALGGIEQLFDRDPAAGIAESPDGMLSNVPASLLDSSGREHEMLVNVTRVDIDDGRLLYVARDVTGFNLTASLLDRIFRNSTYAIVVVHPTRRTIVQCNPAIQNLLGYEPKELLGRSTRIIHVDDASFSWYGRISAESIAQSGSHRGEFRLRHRNGRIVPVEIHTLPVSSYETRGHGFVSLIQDTSEKRRAADAASMIQEVVKRTAGVEETDGSLPVVLEAVCKRSGWPVGEAWKVSPNASGHWLRAATFSDDDAGRRYLQSTRGLALGDDDALAGACAAQGRPLLLATPGARGRDRPRTADAALASGMVAACAVPLATDSGVDTVLTFWMRDVRIDCDSWLDAVAAALVPFSALLQRARSEQALRERETELRQSRESLRQLARRVQQLRENERREIARELHDQMGSDLTGLKLELQLIREQLGASDPPAGHVDSATRLVDSMIGNMRQLATRLRPSILDVYGLGAGIEWLVKEFERRSGCRVTARIEETGLPLGDDRNIVLFRICQESLTNILRHAGASEVSVTLAASGSRVVLAVEDDGVGVDERQLRTSQRLGIVGMRERARSIGGRLQIDCREGGGTRVHVTVPLDGGRRHAVA